MVAAEATAASCSSRRVVRSGLCLCSVEPSDCLPGRGVRAPRMVAAAVPKGARPASPAEGASVPYVLMPWAGSAEGAACAPRRPTRRG